MRQILVGSILWASSSTMGCTLLHDNPLVTRGELGKADFVYAGCLFDCSLDQAMMHGTEESISVSATGMPAITVMSTSPSVVSVKDAAPMRSCCPVKANGQSCRPIQPTDSCNADETANIGIGVVASSPGSAELVLTQTDGTVFDRVAIAVAEPASLELGMGTSYSVGTSYAVSWTARDGKGAKLMSTSGVHMVTSDASVVDFKRTFLSSNSSSVDAEDIIFGTTMEPHAHGDATITATAQNVTTTFTAHVN